MFEHRAAHRRRHGLRCAPQLFGRPRSGRFCLGRSRGRGRRCNRRARTSFDHRDHRADFDRVAHSHTVFGHDAGDRRRHVDRDLVGFEADDRLVHGNRFARLLEPFGDGAFGNGFAQSGDFDFGGHGSGFLKLGFIWCKVWRAVRAPARRRPAPPAAPCGGWRGPWRAKRRRRVRHRQDAYRCVRRRSAHPRCAH